MVAQTDNSAKTILGIGSVSKAFGPRPVLKDVTLDVPPGQAVCVCGINGAGKSTLLRIVAGLLRPDHGSITIRGRTLASHPEGFKRQLAMISHASMVYAELTVLENLNFAADLQGLSNRADRISRALSDMGLGPFRYDRAGTLSRGWLQRLAIARALLHEPAVLLADEPFTGLDLEAIGRLGAIFDEFIQRGRSLLMTTHDLNLGLRCCHRVIVLDRGAIILDAMVDDLDVERFADDYLSYARSQV